MSDPLTRNIDESLDSRIFGTGNMKTSIENLKEQIGTVDGAMELLAEIRSQNPEIGLLVDQFIAKTHQESFPDILSMPGAAPSSIIDALDQIQGDTPHQMFENFRKIATQMKPEIAEFGDQLSKKISQGVGRDFFEISEENNTN